MIFMAGISRRLSLSVFVLFFLNSFASSNSNGPDGRFASSPPTLLPPVPSSEDEEQHSVDQKNNDVIVSSGTSKIHGEASIDTSNKDFTNSTTTNRATTAAIQSSSNEITNNYNNNIPLWKQQLPFPLNNKTKSLQRILVPGGDPRSSSGSSCDVEVFLLGTAHISTDSSRDVRLLLESVEPDVIFLELCHQRLPLLETADTSDDDNNDNNDQQQQQEEENPNSKPATGWFWNRWRKNKASSKNKSKQRIDTRSLSSVASSLLSNMQGDFADSLEVELGGEFRAAYQYWKKIVFSSGSSGSNSNINSNNNNNSNINSNSNSNNNVHMILGDRPVSLTLTRAWESLRIWGKIKLMVGLLISSLRKPNPEELREWMEKILQGDTDLMSDSVAELAKHFPTLEEVILKERDAYMACKLHQTCRSLLLASSSSNSNSNSPSDGNHHRRYRLVAIVGAGHVEGICRWLTTGGSLTTITTVATTTTTSASSSTSSTSLSTTTNDVSQQPQETPEDILSKLIQIKAAIPKEDHDYLVHEITELNEQLS